jgi:quinol monooxygenase YgiN
MQPVHIAITRKVTPGVEERSEKALHIFIRESLNEPGTTGEQLVRPDSNADAREFGILRTFESKAAGKAFYTSDMFAKWEERNAPMVVVKPTQRRLLSRFRQNAATMENGNSYWDGRISGGVAAVVDSADTAVRSPSTARRRNS